MGRLTITNNLLTGSLSDDLNLFIVGSTERQILEDLEGIIHHSLPDEKMTNYFQDQQSAAMYITNKVVFCQDRIKVLFHILPVL